MSLLNKNFFIGILVGVALALVALDLWAYRLQRSTFANLQVHLLKPLMNGPRPPLNMKSLPRPEFPKQSRGLQDGWKVQTLDGKSVKLADLKGKVVFLDFWLTTCGPCLAELPGIEKLQASLRNEPVAFLIVSPEDPQKVRDFLQKHPLHLPVYLTERPPADLGWVAYPTTVILNRSGAVVYRHTGALNWDDNGARAFIRDLTTPEATSPRAEVS